MRFLPICLAALIAAPAFAEPPNAGTYKAVIEKGVFLVVAGQEIDVAFTPDGKFTAMQGMASGTWKIEGDKLCTTAEQTGVTDCAAYPAGKKSGDSFELATPNGDVTIRIR